jgi:energy-converting hydrogenase Eha subunit A
MSDQRVTIAAELPAPAEKRSSTNTVWIWVLLFLPLAWVVLLFAPDVGGALALAQSGRVPGSFAPVLVWLITSAVVIVLGTVALGALGLLSAYRDCLRLRRMPIEQPFRWAWQFTALVGLPVYAIGRAVVVRRRTGRGLAVLVTSIVVNVLAIVFVVLWLSYKALQLVFILTLIATGP